MAGAAIGIGGSLVSSLLGGIFGNKPQKTTYSEDQSSQSQSNQDYNNSTQPLYDPQTQAFRDNMLNYFMNSVYGAKPDVSGQISQGLAGINNASSLRTMAINQSLAARGLGTSPVAANSLINEQGFRVGQGVQLQNTAPQLQEQIQNQRAQLAAQFFSSLPVGQQSQGTASGTQSGTSSKNGEQTGTGNQLGGGLSSLGTTMGYFAGKGMFGKTPWQK